MTPAAFRQTEAADPRKNTWLSANAGSGKTRVLTDRVARLLLGGVEPQHILCLTYTKAAASEMQNRLFKRLGAWSMKPDAALRDDLGQLGETEGLDPEKLALARQLFARAIEAPGGLRIQTIHSFCASLLRRFPLEAGVSPAFTELDDRSARLLRDEILEEMAEVLAPDVVNRLTTVCNLENFDDLIEQVARTRAGFSKPLSLAECKTLFGLPMDFTEAEHVRTVVLGDEARWLPKVIQKMLASSKGDTVPATKLAAANLNDPDFATLELLESALLYTEKTANPFQAKIDRLPTQPLQKVLADLMPDLNALMSRVEAGRERRLALLAAGKTAALHAFAAVFLPLYDARKVSRGLLDFDDLILRANAMLTDPSLAAWVLYRLDGGIDHILVDEAQDTSPDQWHLIESLAAEFTAGIGAKTRPRSIFVVGDKKQSIYSFQGADVAAFDQKRTLFRDRLSAAGLGLVDSALLHSFRSSWAILRVVDQTFADAHLGALGGDVRHLAFHDGLAGRVDLWQPVEKAEKPDQGDWFDPVDLSAPQDPTVILAGKIAEQIKEMIETGVQIPVSGGEPRPVHAGDFLVLVQRRSLLFQEIIRACKARDLPIAGADRLKLGAELAVKDVAALLGFLDTPEDDLALATVLTSPLCGWSASALFSLSHGRKGYLWQALRADPDQSETVEFLQDLRDQTDFMRPFDLIERLLNRHDGRRKLLARLGPEAEDGIDELLSQALAYERSEVPSLTGFLTWLETDDVEVKRQLDSEGDRIRVMTVHGAKGLEAPIVILPDTAKRTPRDRDEVYRAANGPALWKTVKAESPALIAALRDARSVKRAEESLRLLYVAMTRARCWLIVATTGAASDGDGWYSLISTAADALGVTRGADGSRRFQLGDWPVNRLVSVTSTAGVSLPDWAVQPAPRSLEAAPALSPSDLGGSKALPGEPVEGDADLSKRLGKALHLLLEHLPQTPPNARSGRAAVLVPEPDLLARVLPEALSVLSAPLLSAIFAPGTLAEVTLTGSWNGHRIVGTVDRLIITPERILVVDYKSNAVIPDRPEDGPEGLLRQMGAYAHVLGQIYPDRKIEVAILWTKASRLMMLDSNIVRVALARTTIP